MTMQPLGDARSRPVQSQAFDIQAIVGSGFAPLKHCTYRFLQVSNRGLACRWLRRLLDADLVKSVADLGVSVDTRPKRTHREVATVAVSHAGLRLLDIEETEAHPFPTVFRMGNTHPLRAQLLGDTEASSWTWGDYAGTETAPPAVHLVVAHFRQRRAVNRRSPFAAAALDVAASGLTVVASIETCPSFIEAVAVDGAEEWQSVEPFGFRDGLSQPVIDGLRPFSGFLDPVEPTLSSTSDDVIQPGEFLLGHLTEYGEPSYCPDVKGWGDRTTIDGQPSSFGFNGTYLAIRQIAQKVEAFAAFESGQPAPAVAGQPTPAERMVGRRKDGKPLQTVPVVPRTLNDFRYRLADAEGFQCPVGAHIRRANPRDTLGWDTASGVKLSKRHRILRRGRAYGQADDCKRPDCGDAAHRRSCGRGILFVAINGDLERQFELILKRWLGNPSFNQYDASDPIVGTSTSKQFARPALPIGTHCRAMQDFTQVIGAGYFFMPGLNALRFIATRA